MGSIATECGNVNVKALFAEELAKAQAEVAKRLGEEVGKRLDESIDQVLLISRLTFYEHSVAYYVLREGFRHVARNT